MRFDSPAGILRYPWPWTDCSDIAQARMNNSGPFMVDGLQQFAKSIIICIINYDEKGRELASINQGNGQIVN